jgi:ABC-type sugar transport system substrate-binding protein
MKTVALLLDDPANRYQQLLAREAKAAAGRLGLTLLDPEFAEGSAWTQAESVNAHLRRESRPDAMLVMLAGGLRTRSVFERVAKAGLAVVFLNRVPPWAAELRALFPANLIAAVAPDQEGIGAIQGRQASRLAPPGALVILVTGEAQSPAAVDRTRGFLGVLGERLVVRDVDGRWSAAAAEKAVSAWFRFGAERDRPVDLVVCQNDAMASGARAALAAHATGPGRAEAARVPLVGCDGMPEEGLAMVARGELAATVVVPPTTPEALEVLARYRDTGARAETVRLEAASFPRLEGIGPR